MEVKEKQKKETKTKKKKKQKQKLKAISYCQVFPFYRAPFLCTWNIIIKKKNTTPVIVDVEK